MKKSILSIVALFCLSAVCLAGVSAGTNVYITSGTIPVTPASIGAATAAQGAKADAALPLAGGTMTGTLTGGTNAQGTFSASAPIFQGSNITAPNQTLTGSTSVLTPAIADGRYGSPGASTLFYTSTNGSSYIIRSSSNAAIFYCSGYAVFTGTASSVKIAPYYPTTDWSLRGVGTQAFGTCTFDQSTSLCLSISGGWGTRASGPAPNNTASATNIGGLKYTFGTAFSANVGDTIVLSPSGHTFTVDATIASSTTVAVRDILRSPTPTTSDTSLKVNGGGSITTSWLSNGVSNSGTYPSGVFYWNTNDGWRVFTSSLNTLSIYYEIEAIHY